MTSLYEDLVNRKESLALIGLGYVGMPIAVAFAKKINVIGYDLNAEKIALYKSGIDPTHEIGDEGIKETTVEFTSDEKDLERARFFVVAVPTPIYDDHTPNLSPVESASEIVGRRLRKGSVVVFESTVYPGVTEEVCVPILERESGMKCGVDFKVGYSPERINPGDKEHRLETITKIVSGMDAETLDCVAKTYELVVKAGVHRAPTIKVAEASKVIENSQRDINIASGEHEVEFPSLLSRFGRRSLHRRRPVLSNLPRRRAGLSQPNHSFGTNGQRRHGQIRCGKLH